MAYYKQWMILAGIALFVYALVVAVAYSSQRSLLYFPTHLEVTTRLSPWFIDRALVGYARETPEPPRVWLMMHGNGGQAAHRDYILRCVDAADSVYVLEYPGYGFRTGTPTQSSINRAASDAYRTLRRQFPKARLGVIGESLGSGPASALASEPVPPDRIVLVTPFDSLLKLAAEYRWYLPVRLILKDRWDNVETLRDYRGPIDIYGARDDHVIPIWHAEALATAVHARFTVLACGHNDWADKGLVKLD